MGLLTRPTPVLVKRLATSAGVEEELKRVKEAGHAAREGALLQAGFWIGRLPARRLRHALYRRMGLELGARACVHRGLELRSAHRVRIGEGSVIGFDAILDGRAGIYIGRHVNLSSSVAIWTVQHDHRDPGFRVPAAPSWSAIAPGSASAAPCFPASRSARAPSSPRGPWSPRMFRATRSSPGSPLA